MAKTMRSASLDGFVPLARSCGLDPMKLLDKAGIPRDCLRNPDLRLSIGAYCSLLEASAKAAGADDFGVRLAESRQLSTFGPVGLVVREQPTVRKAIQALVDNIRLHNDSASLELDEAADDVSIIKPDLATARGVPAAQAKDMVLGVVCRILTLLLGPTWRPESVWFVRSRPANLAAFRRVFGTQLEFSQDFNGIVCKRRDIDQPIAGADPGMAREAARYVALLRPTGRRSGAEYIRSIVLTLLPTGQCTVEQVARHLGVDRRTVHRHLAAQDTTFSEIVDDLRHELCVSYIEHGDRPLASVAELLGFSAQSAFAHWHQERYGMSATARRVAARRG